MESYLVWGAALQAVSIITAIAFNPPMTIDIYRTSLNLIFNVHTNQTNVDSLSPVNIVFRHSMSLTEIILMLTIATTAYLMLTRTMLKSYSDNGNTGILDDPFSTENSDIAASPAILLWNTLFAFILCGIHFIYLAVAITPCTPEYIVLCNLVISIPLVLIAMPRKPNNTFESAPPLLCGIPGHLIYLAVFMSSAIYIMSAITYDPNTFKVQLLLLMIANDILIFALGHLWDFPPSITTVLNCRIGYIAIYTISLLSLLYLQSIFTTQYSTE